MHALDSLMNQGVLTSIFGLGAVLVFVGSAIFIKERVKMCEYMGTACVIAGTILISLSKKEGNPGEEKHALEGPAMSILFAIGACCCFGIRSCTLKYMAIKCGVDGVSASAVFLMVDGLLGGIIGISLALTGRGYANFPASNILLGICSGILAGTGVLSINIAVSTGVAGPAFAIANLAAVIQALGDWGFLGQAPASVEWGGLIVSVFGGIIMSIGDDYFLPLFFKKKATQEEEDLKLGSKLDKTIEQEEFIRNATKKMMNK